MQGKDHGDHGDIEESSGYTVCVAFAPDSHKKLTEIIVSTNRGEKARNERLPYDCRAVAAVPVGGVREGEERGEENSLREAEGRKVLCVSKFAKREC